MKFHDFKASDVESLHWSQVAVGDLVRSPGSSAFRANAFAERTPRTRVLSLANGLLLVVSRFDGVPGEPEYDDENITTFVVLSRHGPLVLMKTKPRRKKETP